MARFHLLRLLVAQIKVDHGSADLDRSAHSRKDFEAFLNHDQSAKFAQVVHENELIVHKLDLGMIA